MKKEKETPVKKGRPNKYGANIETCKLQINVPIHLHDKIKNEILAIIDAELLKEGK